jgi:hypothetical protein
MRRRSTRTRYVYCVNLASRFGRRGLRFGSCLRLPIILLCSVSISDLYHREPKRFSRRRSWTGIAVSTVRAFLAHICFSTNHDDIQRDLKSRESPEMSFGILVSLWSASMGMTAVMDTLNSAYKVKETQSLVKQYAVARPDGRDHTYPGLIDSCGPRRRAARDGDCSWDVSS